MEQEKRFGLGVVVCVFNRDFSKILLLKRNEEKRKKFGADWGNIGGRIEFGELSIQAGVREASEETGLKLNPEDLMLIEVKERPNHYANVHGVQFIYFIALDENQQININHESDEYKWFDINKLPDKMIDSKEEIIKFKNMAKKEFS
jgi:8-oxo-dGTP pyrophosphatase MutT (NUDIX family)